VTDSVDQLIQRLGLAPHPEGGHYREVFRSERQVDPLDGRSRRSALTTIHFLLVSGQHSRWHRVLSDEIWQFQRGEPLELLVAAPGLESVDTVVLGPEDALVHTVPAEYWQAARPKGAWSLCACTVGPGFEFDDFSFLRDDRSSLDRLERLDSGLATLA
jgi:predicted cupin superfamily sugar epimerase